MTYIVVFNMASKKTIIQNVQGGDFVDDLRSFLDMLQTCIGPKGAVKILISGGDISTVTSSSIRLLNSIVICHPLLILISQVMKSQVTIYGDCGLYLGSLTCSLVERAFKQDQIKQTKIFDIIQHLISRMSYLLNLEGMKIHLDMNTVGQLLSVARTVLVSKPSCGLNKTDIHKLSIQIVKVFLNTIDAEFGNIIVVNSGSSEGMNTIVDGVLYQIGIEENVEDFISNFTSKDVKIKLLLFNIMLTYTNSEHKQHLEHEEDIVKKAEYVLEHAVKMSVNVVACQKVVDSSLKLFLRRKGVLLLDRLGTELTDAIEKMSGAKCISSLEKSTVNYLDSFIGSVDSIKLVSYGRRQFFCLEKQDTNVATLMLHSCSEEAYSELKVVVQQVLTTLRQVTCQPTVVPGAGCLEMIMAVQIQLKSALDDGSYERRSYYAVVSWLQKAFLATVGITGATSNFQAADTVFCHRWESWNPDDSVSCSCGLVKAIDVREAGGKWIELNCLLGNELVFTQVDAFPAQPQVPKTVHESAVVDISLSKSNAIKLALETTMNILNIGLVVYKTSA